MPPPEPNEALDLKLLYEEAPCGLLLTDGSGLLMSANATFLKWFGYELSDLLGSQRFQDLLSVGGKIFYQTHIGPLLEMQKSVAEVKFDIKHRDGQKLMRQRKRSFFDRAPLPRVLPISARLARYLGSS